MCSACTEGFIPFTSTQAATLYMRMYLMSHAGGGSIVSLDSMQSDVANQHIVLVDDEKRHQIQNPSTWDIAKQAMRGFA